MKFRPLHDRVLVERVAEETKSAGGILIPDNAREKPQQGLGRGGGHPVRCWTTAASAHRASKKGTEFCLASTRAARSSSTARST